MSEDVDEIRRRFERLNVWKRGSTRAPHKPLLVLLALGRLQRGDPRLVAYREVNKRFRDLLEEFGPRRKSYHPEYPFWRLQTDGIWTVTYEGDMRRRTGSDDVPHRELLVHEAAGGFTNEVQRQLEADPALLQLIARQVLDEHFPDTLHDDVVNAVGLSLDWSTSRRRKRDPAFREEVLRAYEYRCAVCGHDVRLRHAPMGLEAAHIKWHQVGGPDTVNNGLALCSIHHRALDYGALGLTDQLTIELSAELGGNDSFRDVFLRYHQQPLRRPQGEALLPKPAFLKWHRREVFRSPGRGVAE